MAKIKTANQQFDIPDQWVVLADDSAEAKSRRDARLKHLLSTYLPAITNAQLTYRTEGEETIVTVVPQLGTKGAGITTESLFASRFPSRMQCNLDEVPRSLQQAPPAMPAALLLAWQVTILRANRRLTFEWLQEHHAKIKEVLNEQEHSHLVGQFVLRLNALPPATPPGAPLGF